MKKILCWSMALTAGMQANAQSDSTGNHHSLKHTKQLSEIIISKQNEPYVSTEVSPSLRLNTPIIKIPQNIQVVNAKILTDQIVTSMSDGVIRNVSGLSKLEHWGDLYTRINARGARVAAFRNGMNITSNWGPLSEDMSFVDHIEFVKGPAGFMMSNGEPSGIYNVVTKQPTGISKGEFGMVLGSYNFYRAQLDLDGKLSKDGKLLYRLNAMGQTKGSFRPYEFNDRISIAPVISYQLSDKTKLTFEYIYQRAKMSNVGSYYVFSTKGYGVLPRDFTMANPGVDPTTINDHNVNLSLTHQLNRNWTLSAKGSYFNYKQIGSSMWPSSVDSLGNIIRNVSIWDALNEMKFGQLYLNGSFQTGSIHHNVLAGLDMGDKRYWADWNQSYDLDSAGAYFNVNTPDYASPVNGFPVFDRTNSIKQRAGIYGAVSQQYTGLYAQDEIGFMDNSLRLTLAARYTDAQSNSYGTITSGKRFTPRVGLSYDISAHSTVYALYDQSFVPQTGLRRDREAVKPLTGNNYEIGIKKNWFDDRWTSSLSIYRILKNNQTTNDPANTAAENFIVQFGQTQTQGLEFDLKGSLFPGMNVVLNYAFTDSKISKSDTSSAAQKTVDNKVPGYAAHTANVWLGYKMQHGVLKGFGISYGASLMSDRTTWSWSGASGLASLPDYFRMDAGLFYESGPFRLTANMMNVADKYLYSGAAYAAYYYWQAEAGRNIRLAVNYKF